jgi:branched-chain amino acid transport system permease protein
VLGLSPLTAAAVAAVGVAMFIVPPVYGQFLPQRVSDYLVFGLSALAVGLIAGHARLLNIGVGATFGVSAYVVAILSHRSVLNPVLLMLAALAAGVVVSLLFSLYAVVASGLEYLLLTLLTTAAFFSLPLIFPGLTGGENGLSVQGPVTVAFGLDPLQGSSFYWLLSAITVFWLALSWYLLSSRAGRVMTAIGRNPTRCAAMGYSVHSYRVAVTMYSGLIAASAGWLYALLHSFVFQDLLGLPNSLNSVLYALVGGVDTVLGPLLGAAGLRYFAEYTGQQSTQSQLYIGIALLIVVYFLPAGFLGSLRRLGELRGTLRTVVTQRGREPAGRSGPALGTAAVEEAGLDAVLGTPVDKG